MRLLFAELNLPYLLNDIEYPLGGATIRMHAFMLGLIEDGHQVGCIVYNGLECKNKDKHKQISLIESYKVNHGMKFFRWIFYRIPRLIKSIKSYKPDYILKPCKSINTIIIGLISKILKIKFIYFVANDTDVDERAKRNIFSLQSIIFYYILKTSNIIICQNNYQYETLIKKYPQKSIIIIKNPYYSEKKFEYISNNSRDYIGWVGIFQQQKNLCLLLRCAKELNQIQFKIAGDYSSNCDLVTKKAVAELMKLENVKFVGYLNRKETHYFLQDAIALLNTSLHEGFSNTFLESFSVGTPIITLNRIDVDNIIEKNNLGIVASSDDDLLDKIPIIMNLNNYNEIQKDCIEYLRLHHNYFKQSQKLSQIIYKIG